MDQISINDSLSYSWLREDDNGGAFIDVYPRLLSLRWSEQQTNVSLPTDVVYHDDGKVDVNFDLPSSPDQIRSVFYNEELTSTSSPVQLLLLRQGGEVGGRFSQRCLKTSKKIVWKYLGLLMPVSRIIGMIKGLRVRQSTEKRLLDGRRVWSSGVGGFSWTEFDEGIGRERSIDDAILHCKKSIRNVDQKLRSPA